MYFFENDVAEKSKKKILKLLSFILGKPFDELVITEDHWVGCGFKSESRQKLHTYSMVDIKENNYISHPNWAHQKQI